jgi:hypothetical protein
MSERYVEAPTEYAAKPGEQSLFLAGGITDCPNWQSWMVERLTNSGLILLNPRRANFPLDDPNTASTQIAWEHKHLRLATAIIFWFCAATLNPIVLYELGAWSMTDKPIFVGVEPGYERSLDVQLQTKLARPDVKIVYSLEDVATQVEIWTNRKPKL